MKKYLDYFVFSTGFILYLSGVTVIVFNGMLYGTTGESYESFKSFGIILLGFGGLLILVGTILFLLNTDSVKKAFGILKKSTKRNKGKAVK